MNEFFDQLPQGPIRLSKRLIGRMGRELSGLSQFPPPPSFPGNAGNDSCGPWVDPQFDPIIFAKITAVPTGGYFGYSWLEQQPGPDGGNWYIPKPALQGDNGTDAFTIGPITLVTLNVASGVATFETATDHGFSVDQLVDVAVDDDADHSGIFRITGVPSDTSFTVDMPVGDVGMSISGTATVAARPAKMAAFPATGSDQLAVDDLVIILRGYLNGSANDQQWIAIPFKAGGFRRVRPTGAGVSQESKLYYPSKLDLYDKPTKAFVDGETVWLLSRQGAALSEDGTGIYHSILEDPAFDVGGTVHPLWVTRDRPYLTDVECIAGVLVKTSDGPITVPTTAQMRYVGKWDEDTTYKRGDVVLWASTYVAVVGSVPAGNPPPDPTYWEPLTLDFVSADQQKEVHANVTPDDTDSGVIADNVLANAAALARGVKQVHFPLGKINISTPITLTPAHSGTHLKGAGMGEGINWFNPASGGTWPTTGGGLPTSFNLGDPDCGAEVPIGYLGTFVKTDTTHIWVSEYTDRYKAGEYVFLGHYNATQIRDTDQQTVKIVSVTADTPSVGAVTLEIDPPLTVATTVVGGLDIANIKWAVGSCLIASIVGDVVTLVTHASAADFTAGMRVALADGFAVNDVWVEFFEVTEAGDGTAGTIRISPPPRRTFAAGRTVIIPGPWVENVTIKGFFSDYMRGRNCVNLTVRDTYLSLNAFNIAGSYNTKFYNCGGVWHINSCDRTLLDNCDVLIMSIEESCYDLTVQNSRLYLAWYTQFDTKHLTLINNDVYWDTRGGFFGGSFVQINSGLKTDYVRLLYNHFWTNGFGISIYGDKAQVVGNYLHTGQSITIDGLDNVVEGNYGPGTLILALGSTGKLRNNSCAVVGDINGWDLEHSTNTPFVTDQIVHADRLPAYDLDRNLINFIPVVPIKPHDAYFPLDETTPVDAIDASGNNFPLLMTGNCQVVPGKFGFARNFPTSGEALLDATHDGFGYHPRNPTNFGIAAGGKLTVRALINIQDVGVYGIVAGLWQNNNQWYFAYDGATTGKILVGINGGASVQLFYSTVTPPDDEWVYILFELDDVAKTATLTINGNTPDVFTYTGTLGTADDIFAIGNTAFFIAPFPGYIDDFVLDKRAWTATEKTADYNGGDFSPPALDFGINDIFGSANTWTVGGQQIVIATASDVGFTIQGAASQTGDLYRGVNSSGTLLFGVSSAGRVTVADGVQFGTGTGSARASTTALSFSATTVTLQPTVGNRAMLLEVAMLGTGSVSGFSVRNNADAANASVLALTTPRNSAVAGLSASTTGTGTAITSWSITTLDVIVSARSASATPLTVRGTTSQTGDLQQWQNDVAAVLAYVKADGSFAVPSMTVQAGTSTSLVTVGGRLFTNISSVATTHTDGTFDNLHSNTIAANVLSADRASIEFEYALTVVADPTASVTIRWHYGAVTVSLFNAVAGFTGDVIIRGQFVRVSSSSVRFMLTTTAAGGTPTLPAYRGTVPALTFSGTTTLKLSAASTGGAAAAGDVTAVFSTGKYYPPEA
jgi:hypothetical protein